MPVNLNVSSFLNHANAIDDSRSIVADGNKISDRGKFRSFFTRSSTFRETTNQFINALAQEYGQHVGDIARNMLHDDIEAGKPLRSSTVKEFVALGKQHQLNDSLKGLCRSKASMTDFVKQVTQNRVSDLTDEQFNQLSLCVRSNQGTLVGAMSLDRTGSTLDSLMQAMEKDKVATLLQRSVQLIVGDNDSPLVRIGYPNEKAPQLIQDKLTVLNMLQTIDGPNVDNPTLIQAMTALDTIRQAKPAPGGFTCADLFNAVYPPETTPTMERPANDDIILFTPKQLHGLFQTALEDFTKNFGADRLPADSPLRGTGNHTATSLEAAKSRLFMPATVAHLTGSRVTLADLPQLQFDVSANSQYPDMETAVSCLAKDISRRGMIGMTSEGIQPSISFRPHGGETTTVGVGIRKFEGVEPLNDDQKDYQAGKYNSVSHDIVGSVTNLSASPAQAKAVVGCLTQNGSYPMWHAMKGFGDFAYLREHSAYNQTVSQNADGSIDVSVETSPDLKSLVGTATMTYHVDTDGRVGISDFQWDKPTLQEKKEGMKNCAGYSQSIASRINSYVKSQGMNKTEADFFTRQAHRILDAKVDAATTFEELPSFDSIRDSMPGSADADPKLAILSKLTTSQKSLRFCLNLPQEDLGIFAEVTELMLANDNEMSMNLIEDSLPALKQLKADGNLNRDTAWEAMFGEPMPDRSRSRFDNPRQASSAVSEGQIDLFIDKSVNMDAQMAAFSAFSTGLSWEHSLDIAAGRPPQKITLDMLRTDAGQMLAKDNIENADNAEETLAKDLPRMKDDIGDKDGKIQVDKNQNPNIAIHLASGRPGAPAALEFDPMNPPEMSPEDLQEYNRPVHGNVITRDIRERITEFCGKENRAQITNVMLGICQNGQQFNRNFSLVFNTVGTEHSKCNITVFGDADKNVHVHYENVPGSALNFNLEYSFAPDGGQKLVAFEMARADFQEA